MLIITDPIITAAKYVPESSVPIRRFGIQKAGTLSEMGSIQIYRRPDPYTWRMPGEFALPVKISPSSKAYKTVGLWH